MKGPFLALAKTLLTAAGLILIPDKGVLASMEQKLKEIDEECKIEESRRVDLELNIVEVKGNLKKAEAGPVTLGTAVDTTHLESVGPRVSAACCGPAKLRDQGRGELGPVSLALAQALLFSCHHSPKLLPPPQTVPRSTPLQHSRTGLSPSWSQAKAPSSRKPR